MAETILGVDFTSAPSTRKPITVARATLEGGTLAVHAVDRVPDWAGYEALLREPGPWVGGFDFPFGLPRELVDTLGWPGARSRAKRAWPSLIRHYASLERADIRRAFDRFRASRDIGGKYAHRLTEYAAGAHSAMKLVNPPVGWMLHEGVPRLLAAGVHVPGRAEGDRTRVALEAYPGWLMRIVGRGFGLARPPSYKNDARARQTPVRREARVRLMWAMVEGVAPMGLRVDLPVGLAASAIEDGSGDTLDAIACAVQAAWGAQRAGEGYGLPARMDPVEGWIVSAPWPVRSRRVDKKAYAR